jgi:hypothetical protein
MKHTRYVAPLDANSLEGAETEAEVANFHS